MNKVWFALIVYWINRIVEECFCYGNLKSWWVVQGTDENTTFTLQDDFWFWLKILWKLSHHDAVFTLFVKICINNFIGAYDYIVIFRILNNVFERNNFFVNNRIWSGNFHLLALKSTLNGSKNLTETENFFSILSFDIWMQHKHNLIEDWHCLGYNVPRKKCSEGSIFSAI